jgi:hypothetical protein
MANQLQKADAKLIKALKAQLKPMAHTSPHGNVINWARYTVCLLGDFRLIETDMGRKVIVFNIEDKKYDWVDNAHVYLVIGAMLKHYAEHWEYHHLIPRLLAFAK